MSPGTGPPQRGVPAHHLNTTSLLRSVGITLGPPPSDPSHRAGRLRHFVNNWEQLTSDHWILGTVCGFRLEFTSHPAPSEIQGRHRTSLSRDNEALLTSEIQAMLEKGAIERIDEAQRYFVSPFFAVPKDDGQKIRPIVDLRALNSHIEYHHFKMEGMATVKDLLRSGDFLCKIDLKDAYFHVPVHIDHRHFLQFRFHGKLYQFRCLPFGLSAAPRAFTKVTRPIMATLRQLGSE